MKIFCAIIFIFVAGWASAADGPAFDKSFPRFQSFNAPAAWEASTNNCAPTLWVYKVIPQSFSGDAMSNLMALGAFTLKDKIPGAGFRYRNSDSTRSLKIELSQGWIEYSDSEAQARMSGKITHRPEPAEGVPNDAEVEELALKLLRQLGISRSGLATRPGTSRLMSFGEKGTRGYLDKARGVYVDDEVHTRGIFFIRQVDGVSFAGIGTAGGFEAEYGNHAAVSKLNLVWRNLQRYEQRKVATSDEIIRFIREGKAVMAHKNIVDPAQVKKLTITEMAPLYMGAGGKARQDFVYPFAQIEAMADMGQTNINIQLYTPILGQPVH